MNYQDLFLLKIKKKKKMSATKNECNRGSPSIYRPNANAWISKRSSDLDYKGVFALIKIGFLQSSFYEVMWSSLLFVCTSVVSYVAFVLSLFVPYRYFFCVSRWLCFVIVAFLGYLHLLLSKTPKFDYTFLAIKFTCHARSEIFLALIRPSQGF